jgi:hypothetical protein
MDKSPMGLAENKLKGGLYGLQITRNRILRMIT